MCIITLGIYIYFVVIDNELDRIELLILLIILTFYYLFGVLVIYKYYRIGILVVCEIGSYY